MARDGELDRVRERIWRLVHTIPRGKVATYGQIASLAGLPNHARMVGRAMRNLPPGSQLPWHRVVNAAGRISTSGAEQRQRLEAEGVVFLTGRIDLKQYGWKP